MELLRCIFRLNVFYKESQLLAVCVPSSVCGGMPLKLVHLTLSISFNL